MEKIYVKGVVYYLLNINSAALLVMVQDPLLQVVVSLQLLPQRFY